jgi:hypothetical protein
MDTMFTGTMGTTEEDTFDFHAVTNDLTSAVSTFGYQRVDGTFETIKHMRFASHAYFKTFIVFVSANFTGADGAVANY